MIRRTVYTILMLLTSCIISAQSIASHPQLKVMSNILKNMDYEWLISEEDFKTMIIVPLDEGMLSYIDPQSYADGPVNKLWEIVYGKIRETAKIETLHARIYDYVFNESLGIWEKFDNDNPKIYDYNNNVLKNRLADFLDNIIIKGDYQEGKLYYKTIGDMIVRIDGVEKGSYIYGPLQMENDTPLQVVETFVDKGCRVLIVDGPVMSARKSVDMLINEKPELSKFGEIVEVCCSYASCTEDKLTAAAYGGGNMLYYHYNYKGNSNPYYLLNDFHYTIYAPTNEAMEKAFAKGLPTIDDLRAAVEYDIQTTGEIGDSTIKIKSVMINFVKYHIQDFSIFIDKGAKSGKYNTAKNILEENKAIRPYRLNVDVSESSMRVTDALGNTHNVITNAGLHNMVANEYWFKSSNIQNSSTVVIHAIDGPLMYSNNQFVYEIGYIK